MFNIDLDDNLDEDEYTIVGIDDEQENEEIVSIFEYSKQKQDALKQKEEAQNDKDDNYNEFEKLITNDEYVSEDGETDYSDQVYEDLENYKQAIRERKNKAVEKISYKYSRRKLYMRRRGMLIFTVIAVIFVLILSLLITTSDAASGYSIMVNYEANTVTIYQDGNPIKAMVCSTGRATPHSGTYRLNNKYRWLSLVGGVYGQYCTRIVGSILFHSVPYYINGDGSSLEWDEYDKLGTSASAGCVRLQCSDAKWIYDNIPAGTNVTFYADSNPGPLGKPESQHLSGLPDYYRCWDPTDPSSSNPWRNFNDVTFDANYYANKYQDLRNAFGYDAQKLRNHWYDHGVDEGRQASPSFDVRFYMANYVDLQKAFGANNFYKGFEHFIFNGIKEGRTTAEEFDINIYKSNYVDLRNAFGGNNTNYFAHYNNYGVKENRNARLESQLYKIVFNAGYYADKYSDLKSAFGYDEGQLFKHYMEYGVKEGRKANIVFDIVYYLGSYQDLQNAFGKTNYYTAFKHFRQNGVNELRKTSEEFNVEMYKANYEDLRKAFGNNNKEYFIHYLEYGVKENRIANALIENQDKQENKVKSDVVQDNLNEIKEENQNNIIDNKASILNENQKVINKKENVVIEEDNKSIENTNKIENTTVENTSVEDVNKQDVNKIENDITNNKVDNIVEESNVLNTINNTIN